MEEAENKVYNLKLAGFWILGVVIFYIITGGNNWILVLGIGIPILALILRSAIKARLTFCFTPSIPQSHLLTSRHTFRQRIPTLRWLGGWGEGGWLIQA
jgi:hypothetical protein